MDHLCNKEFYSSFSTLIEHVSFPVSKIISESLISHSIETAGQTNYQRGGESVIVFEHPIRFTKTMKSDGNSLDLCLTF